MMHKKETTIRKIIYILSIFLILAFFIPIVSVVDEARQLMLENKTYENLADISMYEYCKIFKNPDFYRSLTDFELKFNIGIYSFTVWSGVLFIISVFKRWYKIAIFWSIISMLSYSAVIADILMKGIVGKEYSKAIFAFGCYFVGIMIILIFALSITLQVIKRKRKTITI
ncbi:MAG: hypothetical protein SPI49_03380 [Eubacteriales bacterium]|nr:hypothetical protein [Eubacteriales bacterium]